VHGRSLDFLWSAVFAKGDCGAVPCPAIEVNALDSELIACLDRLMKSDDRFELAEKQFLINDANPIEILKHCLQPSIGYADGTPALNPIISTIRFQKSKGDAIGSARFKKSLKHIKSIG